MERIGIGFLGCGNIGCGVYRLLETYGAEIDKNEGVSFEVRSILVHDLNKKRPVPQELLTDCVSNVLDDPAISIVMEFMGGEEPAASYMKRALENGKTVVTANKMALATHWTELMNAAQAHASGLYYEASVCGAVPIIRALTDSLQANHITSVMGIINGTTNYILSRMSKEGASYAEVLADAQQLGLAEPDPTADVEGYDAAYKLSILSTLAFHRHVPVEQVYREGITAVTAEDVQLGQAFGLTVKLLGIAKETDGEVQARVHPTFVPNDHPLSSVNDAFNAVYVNGHACGEMMFYGRGAGDMPTASALVSDLIKAAKAKRHALPAVREEVLQTARDWKSVYYIGAKAEHMSEVLEAFQTEGIQAATEVKTCTNGEVSAFLTECASECLVRRALNRAEKFGVRMIRVENAEN